MNETIELLKERKSVRIFENKAISIDMQRQILEAAILAPTAGNMQLYSIIRVDNQAIKDKLAILCDNQPFIKEAKMVLVFVSDATRWYKMFNYVDAKDAMKPCLADYYLGFCDAQIAAQNAVIAAQSLGIGSCYIGDIVENYEKIKELLNLPLHVACVSMVVFGYPTQQQKERTATKRFPLDVVLMNDQYRNDDCSIIYDAYKYKINQGVDYNEQDQKTRTDNFILKMKANKQNTAFFREMNRSLELALKEFNQ